ncbi:MAG: DUF4367 domain-containing protein [Mediterraneibacter sp.]
MKKEYTQNEMEQILRNDAEIPESVERRMKDTYEKLGLVENTGITANTDGKQNGRRTVRRRRPRAWVSAAAAAAVIAGLGLTAFAAARALNVTVKEEDGKVEQQVSVEPTQKEAHKIEVTAGYVPEGYVYQEEGPFTGKYRNEATGGGMTLIPYNAAEVYWFNMTGDDRLEVIYNQEDFVGTVETNGMTANLFQTDSIYEDDNSVTQNAYVFNEEEGYAIQVYLRGTGLPEDEVLKVAQNLQVTILDETVAYATDEEIEAEKEMQASYRPQKGSIESYRVHQIGDVITAPDSVQSTDGADLADLQYTVKDAQILDTLPLDQYPKENYVPDYDSAVAPLLNEDGTLKPHIRYPYTESTRDIDKDRGEEVNGKFLAVTVDITNTADAVGEFEITPELTLLKSRNTDGSGYYEEFEYIEGTKAYLELNGDGAPFYQSVQQFTENRKKHVRFAEIGAGETIECTFVYVVDEDCVENACLEFFNTGGSSLYPYVKLAD